MELNPCPFCGSDPWVGPAPESNQFELVACCDRKCHISEVYMPTIKWQSRPIEDAQAAEIARLKEQNQDLLDCLNGSTKAVYTAEQYDKLKARVAELEGEVEFWKSASEAQRRKNCDECVRIAEGKMVAKLQARVAELEAMLHDIIDSIPSTYDEEDPTVKRHAAALNVAWNSLKEVGHDG